MKSNKNQSDKSNEENEEMDEGNTKMYMVALFLVGIVLGALMSYGYLTSEKPIKVIEENFNKTIKGNAPGILANYTPNSTVVQKAILFLNDAFLSANGLTATLDSSSTVGAQILNIRISGAEGIQNTEMYLIDNRLIVIPYFAYDVSNYTKTTTLTDNTIPNITKTDKPEVKFFVMSFCPFGKKAEISLKPVAELLGSKANLEPHFVIYEKYKGGSPNYCMAEGSYCSMHGIDELKEDIRQMCIWKYEKEKWWQYVDYVNKNCSLNNIETCWQNAANATGVNATKISECEANEALELLAAEKALNEIYAAKVGESSLASPMVFINDVLYSGSRTAEAYKNAICSAFNTAPEECNTTLSTSSSGVEGKC